MTLFRLLVAVGVIGVRTALAQTPTVTLQVLVTDTTASPLAGATLYLSPAGSAPTLTRIAGPDGRATFSGLTGGSVRLVVTHPGYATAREVIDLQVGPTAFHTVRLRSSSQTLQTVRIVALPPDLIPTESADRTRLLATVPHDASAVLRDLPGTDAMRRGALGLDPVVRGLRDMQLGVYVDAARTLPGGPAGRDTPMSHVDPAHVERIEVITGPYALTWGSGNLSAIRVTTASLPARDAAPLRSQLGLGYDGNLRAQELTGRIDGALGRAGRFRYLASAASRSGQDYRDGNGTDIASRFRSSEGRARLGLTLTPRSELSLLASYQAQRDVDYPGRPLDAAYFDTYQLQAEYAWRADRAGTLRAADAMVYIYDVDHLMDNDDKPTALPDPTRVPPFATDITTRSGVRIIGGRVAGRFAHRGWQLEIGGDAMHADHDANRRVDRRDTGAPVRRDLIWGGAWIQTIGTFARAEHAIGASRLGVTLRSDLVRANADTVSPFFVTQYGTARASSELNGSAAATWRFPLSSRWTATVGVGSVVRTAEANERFSDRAASKRSQTNAEFLGDPGLRPERSTQGDLWLEGRLGRTTLTVNSFVRRLDDYITIEATDLPRAQPGSPPPVFRYVNGSARYLGGEAQLLVTATPELTIGATTSVLRGDDLLVDEPALGVTPVRVSVLARFAPLGASWHVEGQVTSAGTQRRVATLRGEIATPGWTTVDLQGAYRPRQAGWRHLEVRAGVRNLLDRPYVHHLSALNAFGGGRLTEPGRVLFLRLTVGG